MDFLIGNDSRPQTSLFCVFQFANENAGTQIEIQNGTDEQSPAHSFVDSRKKHRRKWLKRLPPATRPSPTFAR